MTALPLRDFTAAEQDKLDAIEAAPAAAESLRERVARWLWESQPNPRPWLEVSDLTRDFWRTRADALIAVLSGPSSDAEQAVERVQALADRHEACCQFIAVWDLRLAVRGES
jgi:hypothetical protein